MSSFRKKNVQTPIPLTRTSPQTGQVITTTGNISLDTLLGGGLPIGSICLIEEDKFVTYSKVLVKYFLAEGIFAHSIFLGSLDDNPKELLHKLPRKLVDEELQQELKQKQPREEEQKNGLRIAWRYNDLPLINSEASSTEIGHQYNLSMLIDPTALFYCDYITWPDDPLDTDIVVNWNKDTTETEDSAVGEEEDNVNSYSRNNTYDIDELENSKDIIIDEKQIDSAENNSNVTEVAAANENNTPETNTSTTMGNDENAPAQATNNKEDIDVDDDNKMADDDDDATAAAADDTSKALTTSCETSASSPPMPTPPSPLCQTSENQANTSLNSNNKQQMFTNPKYLSLLKEIHGLLREDKFHTGGCLDKTLGRVCITSLGSPSWYEENFGEDLLKFLTVLRSAIRSATSVCFITMPMHLVAKYDESLVAKIRNLVDFSIELESFAGSEKETNPAFKEYNGLIHLHKIAAINTLSAYMPETTDLAFKLGRKKFIIEKLHLPPELQENNSEAASSSANLIATKSAMGCGSNLSPNPNVSLDF